MEDTKPLLKCPCQNWTVMGTPLPPGQHNPHCPDGQVDQDPEPAAFRIDLDEDEN